MKKREFCLRIRQRGWEATVEIELHEELQLSELEQGARLLYMARFN